MTDTPPPTIDITLTPHWLRVWGILGLFAALVVLGLIGAAASPRVDGQPVILTRERLAIKRYLDAADHWSQQFDDMALRFDALGPTALTSVPITMTGALTVSLPASLTLSTPVSLSLPTEALLPAPYPPASQPVNLYDRAQRAEQAITDLQAIEVDLQRIEVPPALGGLHALAQTTLQEFARWSAALLDHLGAPSTATVAAFQSAREAAGVAWQSFRAALQAQPGMATP